MKNRYIDKREAFYNEIRNLQIEKFTCCEIELKIKFEDIRKQFQQIKETIEKAQDAALTKMREKYKSEGKAKEKLKKEKSYSKLEKIKRLCGKIQNAPNGFTDKRANYAAAVLWEIKDLSKRFGTSFIGDTLDDSRIRKKFQYIFDCLLKFTSQIVGEKYNRIENTKTCTKKFNNFFKTYNEEIKQIPWPLKLVKEFLEIFSSCKGKLPWKDSCFMGKINYEFAQNQYLNASFNLAISTQKQISDDVANTSYLKYGLTRFVKTIIPIIDEFDFDHRSTVRRHLEELKEVLSS